jgi:anti-sigma regulatory factor (Ser/Thr protein kinase)
MQPWVLAALGAWAIAARLEKMTIEIENAHTAGYAWRFGLDELLGADVPETVTQHEETGRFIPLKVITGTHDLKPLIADIAPLLHLAGQPDQAKAIQYVMSEMVRNVLEHSRAPAGAVVAAQYYRGERGERPYVSIGVADAGIGIRQSLAGNYPTESDGEALLTAIRPGTTGALHRAENAGAGLFFTRGLSTATNGYFAVGFGDAMFRTSLARQAPFDTELVFPITRPSREPLSA